MVTTTLSSTDFPQLKCSVSRTIDIWPIPLCCDTPVITKVLVDGWLLESNRLRQSHRRIVTVVSRMAPYRIFFPPSNYTPQVWLMSASKLVFSHSLRAESVRPCPIGTSSIPNGVDWRLTSPTQSWVKAVSPWHWDFWVVFFLFIN